MSKKDNYENWRSQYEELLDKKPKEGGNGKVYFVCKDGEELALKQLKKSFAQGGGNSSREKTSRFCREIQIVKKLANNNIPGIIPIYDCSETNFWYVMPIAESIMEYMETSDNRLNDATEFILDLAETLEKLHNLGVYHRDIKPDNIYFYKGRCCLSDFGIAGIVGADGRITPADKQLGAIFTIAPEMKRDPLHADGQKADVFSLAKTLWMLIRNESKGFDGSYDRRDPSIGLSFFSECKNVHIVELEDLLEEATDNAPERRPDMGTFAQKLRIWQEIRQDRRRLQDSEWSYLSKALFAGKQATSATWNDVDAIIAVLKEIARLPAYNHIFLPSNGGLDLVGAERADEAGCIYLMFDPQEIAVVKPKSLTFEGFSEANDWNYFLLELEDLKPILQTENRDCIREILVEDTPGHYIKSDTFTYGVYDYDTGEPLPAGAKCVVRYCRGSFLLTLKQGTYNQCVDYAYQALHDKIDARSIRNLMFVLQKIQYTCEGINVDTREMVNEIFRLDIYDKNKYVQERRDYVSQRQKLDAYLHDKLSGWQFACSTTNSTQSNNICYMFGLHSKNGICLSQGLPKEHRLCQDGRFRQDVAEEEQFKVYTIDEAKRMLQSLQASLHEHLEKAGYNDKYYILPSIHVNLKMLKKPTHVVTRNEISELMMKADDRQDNTLVLDDVGYPHIIQESTDSLFYPVVTETWFAGNCYVGKYADIDGQLETEYALMLQGLYNYLQLGRRVYVDFPCENIEKTLCEIQKLMA